MPVKRVFALFLLGGLALASQAAPAAAHVEVEASPSQIGATKAQLTFRADAESKTAGVAKLEFLADPAIPSNMVTLVGGPVGWKLRPGDFGGFIVEGAALPAGEDAKVTLEVKRLPNARRIIFKVLETYADGRIDRWTDLPASDGKEGEHPVAILELGPTAPKTAAPAAPATPKAATPKSATPPAPVTPKATTPPKPTPATPPAPTPAVKPGEQRQAEVAGKTLARTGSGARWLAGISGLLMVTGGAGITMGAGRRRRA
jgi:hypothetical protein